jgi:hypothetical protein
MEVRFPFVFFCSWQIAIGVLRYMGRVEEYANPRLATLTAVNQTRVAAYNLIRRFRGF